MIDVPYARQARYYDALYASLGKDYAREAELIRSHIAHFVRSNGSKLLDAACGTGAHLEHLQKHFDVQGLDIEECMLDVARERLPGVKLHQGDMRDFKLPEHFDAITCLFSSIGYMQNVGELNSAVKNMAAHLVSGGVLIVEAWFTPEQWQDGHVGAAFVDEPQLKISRINNSLREGNVSIMHMNYTIGTPEGVEHFEETHRMVLFTHEEYMGALQNAGLETHYAGEGFRDRGLYIGVRDERNVRVQS